MDLSVLKFGGTSVGSSENYSKSAVIVRTELKKRKVVVVVSAVSGVTDELIALVDLARKQKQRLIAGRLNRLEEKHREILKAFVSAEEYREIWEKEFTPSFKKLRYVLTGISYVGELTKKTYAFICSFGELLSSRIMQHALEHHGVKGQQVHAKRLIRTNSEYLDAVVDIKRTRENCKRVLEPILRKKTTPVAMGFIGKDSHGDITLLGRGGSDYTASLIGISLSASDIQIWTDVDGVMSADPRVIPKVKLWSKMNIDVMAEMASSGAKVLHPKTITAAVHKNIPVYIKNTFNPKARGTLITTKKKKGLKGVQCVKGQMLIHLKTPEMLNAFGFIQQCSQTFTDNNIPIDVCATSEITFTCSIDKKDYFPRLEKILSKIAHVEVNRDLAKICVIGCEVTQNPKLHGLVYEALNGQRIYTVSSGASLHNITLFVEEKHSDQILKKLHSHLFEN